MPKDTQTYQLAVEITLTDGRWFDGFSAGVFTDMWGREFEVDAEDLSAYLANTIRNIQATSDQDGMIVGLPIDARDHEGGEAAGWIVDIRMAEDGSDKLQFKPKWTETGIELISSGRMRFFSPTFNLKKKVIVGGSLTNWPATRTEDEEILLAPIALSKDKGFMAGVRETIKELFTEFFGDKQEFKQGELQMPKTDKEQVDLVALAQKELNVTGEYADLGVMVKEIAKKQALEMVQHELAEQKRRDEIVQFVQGVTGGTEEQPTGLPVQADKLEEFMTTLNEEQREMAQGILSAIHESGLVSFKEEGHKEEVEGKAELPERVQQALDNGELKLADLGKASMGLGDLSQYNLSKWEKE